MASILDLFDDRKPLYSDELYKKSISSLNKAYEKSGEKVKGVGAAKYRQGLADVGISSIKGGYAGSPVEAALKRRLLGESQATTQGALESLEASRAGKEAEISARSDEMKAQEKMQRDKARAEIISGLLGGGGEILGSLIGTDSIDNILNIEGFDLSKGLDIDDLTSFLEA